ncbi:MAG: FkbM family methyltransferase [Methyloceanibacter sp.]
MTLGVFTAHLGFSTRTLLYRHGTSDEAVLHQIFTSRNYDVARLGRGAEIIDLYNRIVASAKSPLIVDGGAYIGASSIFFDHSFPDARVVAVEPEEQNFVLLQTNTRGTKIEPIRGALASRSGLANVMDPGQGCWGYRTEPAESDGQGANTVKCVTVGEIYERLAGECVPFIVKIDIEGGENDLFSSNTEWVPKTPLIMIELHDWLLAGKANSRPFLRCVSRYDRDFVLRGEDVFSIDNTLVSKAA